MRYLTQIEIARQLGKHEQTIIRWRKQGKIPAPDATDGKRDLWLQATIDEWRKTL